MGFFSAKKTTFDPMSAYTPAQKASIQALMGLASTGTGGGITLGQQYGGALGSYDQTAGELQALGGLEGLVVGQDITGARDVYARMAGNTFNPDDPSSGYAAFSRALAKSGAESADVLNQEAAMTGARFGTGIQRQKASLAEDLANQRGSYLAQLYSQGENRALQGAQGLEGLVGTQQNLFQQLASQAAVERLLKDQQAKDRYAEFGRARTEELSRIGLMQEQWQTPMGKITTKSASGLSNLVSSALGAVGSFLGGSETGRYASNLGTSIFGGQQNNTPTSGGGGLTGGGGIAGLYSKGSGQTATSIQNQQQIGYTNYPTYSNGSSRNASYMNYGRSF